MSDQSKRVVAIAVKRLPEEMRQPFLNELAVIVRDRRSSPDPIRNPPAYLNRMIEKFDEGVLTLSSRCEQVESEEAQACRRRRQEEGRQGREKLAELKHLEWMISMKPNPELQKQADELRSSLNPPLN